MVILQPPKLAAFEPLLCGLQDRQRRVCARACVRACVCVCVCVCVTMKKSARRMASMTSNTGKTSSK